MVDAGRAELHSELHSGAGRELVAVHAQPQSGSPSGEQDRAGLVTGERVRAGRLAEHVHPASERSARGEHVAAHQLDVVRSMGTGRHHVTAKERRLLAHLAGQAQRSGFLGDGQPVATLDLHRRGSLGPHLGHPDARAAGVARRRRRRAWPPPLSRSPLRHRDACHPRRELRCSVAREHQVCVRVDEAGDDRPPAEVAALVAGRRGRARADPGDPAGLDDERRVGHQTEG